MDRTPTVPDLTIEIDGDTWRILSEGALRDGKVYCHLASTTRFNQQRNGVRPLQMCEWIDAKIILCAALERDESARKAIASYYEDRNASGQSPLTAHR